MKEDVLEQIIDDYLQFRGYFTIHNVKFKPRVDHPDYVPNDDRVPSDIDIVAIHPHLSGPEKVRAISCKSWQSGFRADLELGRLRGTHAAPKRPTWKAFRELWIDKWAEAFRSTIEERTGETQFHYSIAVTRLRGDGDAWATEQRIMESLGPGSRFTFLPLASIWAEYLQQLELTPAPSEIGRLAQLLKAAGLVETG